MLSERIISIRKIGSGPTLDIEVNNNRHLFYGNGIATANSHAISYGLLSWISAYQKTFMKTEFYAAWLTYAKWKPDPKEEILELYNDARLFGVKILPPDLRIRNKDFKIKSDNNIWFGLSSIRGLGDSAIKLLEDYKDKIDSINDLIKSTKYLKRSVIEALIKSGSVDFLKTPRIQLLRIIHCIFGRSEIDEVPDEVKPLTTNEYNCFIKNLDKKGISGAIQSIIDEEVCVKKRIAILQSKIEYLKEKPQDTYTLRSAWESVYLGIALTCSASQDHSYKVENRKTCKDIIISTNIKNAQLCVVIDKLTVKIGKSGTKNEGKQFAFMEISDNTGSFTVPIWTENFEKYKDQIYEGIVLSINISKNIKNSKDNIFLNKLEVLG